jgi:hypothetical protein
MLLVALQPLDELLAVREPGTSKAGATEAAEPAAAALSALFVLFVLFVVSSTHIRSPPSVVLRS